MSRREYLLIIFVCFIFIVPVTLLWKKKKGKGALILFSLFTALLLRICYIIYTPHWIRQHDVIGFGNFEGQAPFIEWFVTHLSLPDFDPRERWGFFQPALHHILAAVWIRLQTFAGIAYKRSCENVQILTLFYVLLLLFYAWRMFRMAGLSDWNLTAAFALSAVHPGFILLSGSINNDALCELLTVMSLYYGLCWYRSRSWKDILKTALCIGFSMMAKLSGILAAPAIAFLFLAVWIRERKPGFLKYLKQYLLFGCVSIPLGLCFPVRNYLKFGVPLNYTPGVGEPVYEHSLLSRWLDLRTASPFVHMIRRGDSYDEFNIPLAILKTSLFGDTSFLREDLPLLTPFAWLLLFAGALLALLVVFAVLHVIFCVLRKNGKITCDGTEIWYDLIALAVPVMFLIHLSISIPYFSSQDFRYIQYTVVLQSLFLGRSMKAAGCGERLNPYGGAAVALVGLFGAFTCAVYLLLGVP